MGGRSSVLSGAFGVSERLRAACMTYKAVLHVALKCEDERCVFLKRFPLGTSRVRAADTFLAGNTHLHSTLWAIKGPCAEGSFEELEGLTEGNCFRLFQLLSTPWRHDESVCDAGMAEYPLGMTSPC